MSLALDALISPGVVAVRAESEIVSIQRTFRPCPGSTHVMLYIAVSYSITAVCRTASLIGFHELARWSDAVS